MDKISSAKRSEVMRSVKSKNTDLEMTVRRLLHKAGFRYRLHRKDLPGKPDLVFPGKRKIIFIHGCFWHQHPGCRRATRPIAHADYWNAKLDGNIARDAQHINALHDKGWDTLVVWECDMRDEELLLRRLSQFLCD